MRALGLVFGAMSVCVHGQGNWTDAGLPYHSWGVKQLYTDTVADRLYASGTIVPGQSGYPEIIAVYNGVSWSHLGYYFDNLVLSTVRFGDTLVVGGGFEEAGGIPSSYLAAYYDNAWHAFGTFDQGVRKLKVIDDTLYAVGGFRYVDGHFCNGVARRVGGQWENIGELVQDDNGTPILSSVEKYQGRLYVGGSLSLYDGTNGIAMYDGSTWSGPGGGILGGVSAALGMAVYNGELYVGGAIDVNTGNAGHGLMRWNGSQWHDVGGSMQDRYCGTGYPARARSLLVHDGKLLATGGFGCAGHLPAERFALWDGTNWCGTGDIIPDEVMAMAMYHDTLFLALGGLTVNGDTVPGMVVKWVGGAFKDTCGTVGVREEYTPAVGGLHAWVDEWGILNLMGVPEGKHSVEVYDAAGQVVLRTLTRSIGPRTPVRIVMPPLAGGVYLVHAEGRLSASRFTVIR